MNYLAAVAALAASVNAIAIRGGTCCFEITAEGGASGTVGQLSDGQNRIGGGLPPVKYCIDSTGVIIDGNGRHCILTPPTSQFQCDDGADGTPGFSVSSSNQLEYNGSPNFKACQTGDHGELNIYTNPPSGDVTGCVDVTLEAGNCQAPSPSSSPVSPPEVTSAIPPLPKPSAPGAPPAPNPSAPGAPPAPKPSAPGAPPAPNPSAPGAPPPPETSVTVVTVTETVCATSVSTIPRPTSPPTSSPAPHPPPPETETSPAPQPPPPETETSPAPQPPPSETETSPAPRPTPPETETSPAPRPTPPETETHPSPPPSQTAPAPSPPSSTGQACPTTLTSGSYEYPHLIVPINSASPDTASGSGLNGQISSTVSSIFNFDIPSTDSGKTCSLVFLFPEKSQLQTSSFTFTGDGKVDFSELSSPATESTTYENAPSVKQDYGDFTIAPGNSYTIATFACPAGERVAYEIKNAGSTNLTFFEDYNPSPIGLFITTC